MTREEILRGLMPDLLVRTLDTNPFVPRDAKACYASLQRGERESQESEFLVILLAGAGIHGFRIVTKASKRGQRVERWTIPLSAVSYVRYTWETTSDTYIEEDEALPYSTEFDVKIELDRELGPLGSSITLPMDFRDYRESETQARKAAHAFGSALLAAMGAGEEGEGPTPLVAYGS